MKAEPEYIARSSSEEELEGEVKASVVKMKPESVEKVVFAGLGYTTPSMTLKLVLYCGHCKGTEIKLEELLTHKGTHGFKCGSCGKEVGQGGLDLCLKTWKV